MSRRIGARSCYTIGRFAHQGARVAREISVPLGLAREHCQETAQQQKRIGAVGGGGQVVLAYDVVGPRRAPAGEPIGQERALTRAGRTFNQQDGIYSSVVSPGVKRGKARFSTNEELSPFAGVGSVQALAE